MPPKKKDAKAENEQKQKEIQQQIDAWSAGGAADWEKAMIPHLEGGLQECKKGLASVASKKRTLEQLQEAMQEDGAAAEAERAAAQRRKSGKDVLAAATQNARDQLPCQLRVEIGLR